VTSSNDAVNLEVCHHKASAVAIAVTSCFGNNSTYRVNVSMITIMYLNPISKGEGPIVSIEIRVIGFSIKSTNRDARIVLCRASIFWQVGQLCTNCRTSCRRFGQLAPLISRGACCVVPHPNERTSKNGNVRLVHVA